MHPLVMKAFLFFPSRYGPPTRTEYQLTVENLSSRVSWQVRRSAADFIYLFIAEVGPCLLLSLSLNVGL